MRSTLAAIGSLTLLAAIPAPAETGLTLSCTARDLSPGARVWIEVEVQYQPLAAQSPSEGGFKDAGPGQAARAQHVWRFEVPANGEVTPSSYRFSIPVDRNWRGSDEFAALSLKTRFKIDDSSKAGRAGYGEVTEVTFGMPAPAGVTELSRCLRLRDDGYRLMVETAGSCLDEAFDARRRSGYRVRMKAPGPS